MCKCFKEFVFNNVVLEDAYKDTTSAVFFMLWKLVYNVSYANEKSA